MGSNRTNGPKVPREPLLSVMAGCASGYLLEHLEDPVVLDKSDKPTGADNQQERLSACSESSEAIRQNSGGVSRRMIWSELQGDLQR
jgi:hypothetical protein